MTPTTNKTIAKNTVVLYLRVLITMVISLFTSRVILQKLGVDDFGIYQTVGGLVGLLAFVNSALATGSSRFLTFELGTGDSGKLRRTFSTLLTSHLLLCLIIVLVAESFGLWFIYHKLVIPPERMDAAVFAFHFSVLSTAFAIIQVPYHASIIAHEQLSIYAYTSIVESVMKLGIVYLLAVSPYDRLKTYALLYCLVSIGLALFYILYCLRHNRETHYQFILDKPIFKEVVGYSSWNLFSNTAIALNSQGTTVLINMFFSPGVVAARAVANQVNLAANQFIVNFRTAANPQIVKKYAAGDYQGSKSLLLSSTTYSYFLMLLMALPVCLEAETLLRLWLGIVPEYAVPFLRLAMVTSLFQVFDASFYTALYAKGQIKENALITPLFSFCAFPLIYVLFRMGYSPITMAWVLLGVYAIVGLLVKPLLIIRIVDYTWRDVLSVFYPCLKVTLAAVPIPVLAFVCLEDKCNDLVRFVLICVLSLLSVLVSCWYLGFDEHTRTQLLDIVKKKLHKSAPQP